MLDKDFTKKIIAILLVVPEFTVSEKLTPYHLAATIMAIAIPIILYILQQQADKRDRISRSCFAIIRELK